MLIWCFKERVKKNEKSYWLHPLYQEYVVFVALVGTC